MKKTTSSGLSIKFIGHSLKLTTTGPGVGAGGKTQTNVFGDQYCVGSAGVSPKTQVSPSNKEEITMNDINICFNRF